MAAAEKLELIQSRQSLSLNSLTKFLKKKPDGH
jgi:hypothetical protein